MGRPERPFIPVLLGLPSSRVLAKACGTSGIPGTGCDWSPRRKDRPTAPDQAGLLRIFCEGRIATTESPAISLAPAYLRPFAGV